ncbi:carbohydrate ABC transporter permease [Actinoplanes sp. GCM10030250]|uniref:carbohydrate ABC transporter permease n=1 Tax=Actinoplanes sp. GCM10030250 TaxID=3273376 RepID=UPI00361A1801
MATPTLVEQRRRRETAAGYTFLSPWLLGFFLLTAGPMIASLYLSFTEYDLFSAPEWVGAENYTKLFADERFRHAVTVTLGYVLLATPLKLAAALAVAMLLNGKRKGQGFYRSAFYAPSLIGASVSIAIVWKALFGTEGAVDQIGQFFGWNSGGWVGNPSLSMPMLVLLSVWQFGAPMVIFLAGLKQVPAEIHEAALVDGAGRARHFWSITLPLISPVLFFNLILETIHAFQIFNSAYVISGGNGSPAGSTLFYTLYLYMRGFADLRMGYASAMAWLLALAVAILTLIMFRTSRSWVHYGGDQ